MGKGDGVGGGVGDGVGGGVGGGMGECWRRYVRGCAKGARGGGAF